MSTSSTMNVAAVLEEVQDDLDVIIDLTQPVASDPAALVVHGVPRELRSWALAQKIATPNTAKGVMSVGAPIAAWIGAVLVGGAFPSPFGLVAGWVILLFVLFRLQNVLHEAAHRGVFASTLANDITNAVAGAVFFAPGAAYRAYHFTHHGYTRVEGKDPEGFYESVKGRGTYLVTLVAGGPVFSATMVVGTLRCAIGSRPAWVTSDRVARNVQRQGLASLSLSLVAVLGLLGAGLGPWMLRWWLVPVGIFLCGPFTWATFFEHSGTERGVSILSSSGTVRSNRFFSWVMLNGNFHLAHHVMPTTSWWNLPALDAELRTLCCSPDFDASAALHQGFFAFHRRLWRSLGAA